jgi:polar amino acid transport system ATP-binding protein
MAQLELADIQAGYGATPILRGVSLSVEKGEVVSLVGRSGSGKSTLLRSIIGLTPPKSGRVVLDGRTIDYADRASLRWLRDRVAIVFQQFNLFQNLTVLENVTVAPIQVKRRKPAEARAEGAALLARVGLAGKLGTYPAQLSGGQQQRVAIARALALRPEILLLDEVTSALDPELVGEVLDVMRALAAEGSTMLVVSHEMGFVQEASSRIGFMADGRIVELGKPDDFLSGAKDSRAVDFFARVAKR